MIPAVRILARPTVRPLVRAASVAALLALAAAPARSFCGFYVAKADTKLFNRASKVVLVRHDDKTVLTMASDFEGDPKEFAVVIPSPTFLEEDQIHVTEMKYLDHLDAYTAPRLVEYFDEDPCAIRRMEKRMPATAELSAAASAPARDEATGVTIEATYAVGEYDIVILSAEQSDGLERWLRDNGYRIPDGASRVLESYIKQNVRFFVAKVNLARHEASGAAYLRPIQIAFESPKFVLPIRLGTVNAKEPQELFVMALTRTGRIEPTNYRTVKLPTDAEIPPYVKEEFPAFYRAMFDRLVEREDMRAVFLEYAWDMNWCDPCAADPLTHDELRELGVFWLEGGEDGVVPAPGRPARMIAPQPAAEVFVTRLHLRYTGETFPEDLIFMETGDRTNFQGRFVLRHPYKGPISCPEAKSYVAGLPARQEREVQTLANLTGWDVNEIRRKAGLREGAPGPTPAVRGAAGDKWYHRLWNRDR